MRDDDPAVDPAAVAPDTDAAAAPDLDLPAGMEWIRDKTAADFDHYERTGTWPDAGDQAGDPA